MVADEVRSDELMTLAEAALAHAPGEGHVTARSERTVGAAVGRRVHRGPEESLSVEITAVRDGHTATALAMSADDDAVRTAAAAAVAGAERRAREGAGRYPGLPPPAARRAHDGWDVATAQLEPGDAQRHLADALASDAMLGGALVARAERTAMAASTGLRVGDAVTSALLTVTARAPRPPAASVSMARGVARLDAAGAVARAGQQLPAGPRRVVEPGTYSVVLGPEAVGSLLDRGAAVVFSGAPVAAGASAGRLVDRLGTRVASAAVNLSDSPRFGATIPRATDAEGVPKAPVPLIQDGIAHGVVHDTRSAALAGAGARSTGHAVALGDAAHDAPAPRNLVLVGGGAADEEELARAIAVGLFIPRFRDPGRSEHGDVGERATDGGVRLIEDGEIGAPVDDVGVQAPLLELLARVEALSARPRLVPGARTTLSYGVVCPALRTSGLRVTGPAT